MEEIDAPVPELVELKVNENWTYAMTSTKTWRVIKFFLEELKPVNTSDIEPEDCMCDICTEDFTSDSHHAVRLPCNHIFGKTCIEQWLRPYASLRITDEAPAALTEALSLGANTCPKCRQVFFPRQKYVDSLPNIESRIRFWDLSFAHVGITPSEVQRQVREDLLQYIGHYSARGLDLYYPSYTNKLPYSFEWVQRMMYFVCREIKGRRLTPAQENLRQSWEDLTRDGFPGGVTYLTDEQDLLFFQIEQDQETEQDGRNEDQVEAEEESNVPTEGNTEEV